MLSELLYLSGLALATAVACNAYEPLARLLAQWVVFDQAKLEFVIFLLVLLVLLLATRFAIKALGALIQWERVHWAVQGLGVIVGGVRGAWAAGVCLLILIATGLPSLVESVKERSLVGPSLVRVSSQYIQQVADWAPHRERRELVPSANFQLPNLKSKWDSDL